MVPGVDVLFSDDFLIACNKPSGLLSVPGRLPENRDSLASRVQAQFPEARVVHRLDCDTSGVMVMALDAETHRRLNRLFHDRLVQKQYLAVCFGILEHDQGRVDLPLLTDWPNRPRQMIDFENGKNALTDYRVISTDHDSSRVLLLPITGRSHQLRVHMMAIGHPILGDPFYAQEQARNAAPRLLLHAWKLEFLHPWTEQWLKLEAPCEF